MDFWLLRLSIALVVLAAGGYMVFMIKQQKPVFIWSLRLLLFGFIGLTLLLLDQYRQMGVTPVLTFQVVLIFFVWAVLGAYLLLYLKFKLMVLGSFIAPVSACLLILSLFVPSPALSIQPAFKNPWLSLHILTSLTGNGMLAVNFMAAVMYLIQEHQIKHKQLGSFYKRLPSLESLDAVSRYSLICGFSLLTLGMITGSIYAQTVLGTYWRWDAKEVWTLIIWIIYAALLHERYAVGLRGRKAAWLSLFAFLVLVFSFIGVNFWLSDYHRFKDMLRPHLP